MNSSPSKKELFIHHEGWLMKKGKAYSRKKWRPRYLVLDNGVISYFSANPNGVDKQFYEKLGFFSVKKAIAESYSTKDRTKYYFKIQTPTRTFHFYAMNTEDIEKWKVALVKNGASWNSQNQEDLVDETPESSELDSYESFIVENLLAKPKVDRRVTHSRVGITMKENEKLVSKVLEASMTGNAEMLIKICKIRGTVLDESFSQNGASCLNIAALFGTTPGHVEVVDFLLSKGLNLNHQDNEGNTPLHEALCKGTSVIDLITEEIDCKKEIAKKLLEKNCIVNIPNNKKQTPLHFAVILGNKSMIEMLLEYGADPNLVDDQGLSPKQLALKRGIDFGSLRNSNEHKSKLVQPLKWHIDYKELKVKKEIGRGHYGYVYEGTWHGTSVAIKQIKTVSNLSQEEVNEFLAEAEIMVNMKPHANVIQIYGVCIDSPVYCIVMEFIPFGNLRKLLDDPRSAISEIQQLQIIKGISAGLGHLHCGDLVHRDLAARNILIKNENGFYFPKISDFGMSKQLGETIRVGELEPLVGPVKWMAPEAISEFKFSKSSDMWSFGILIWEIITREKPHRTLDVPSAASKIRDEYLTPVIPLDFSLSSKFQKALTQIMKDCWNVIPEKRLSAMDVYQIIERLLKETENLDDEFSSLQIQDLDLLPHSKEIENFALEYSGLNPVQKTSSKEKIEAEYGELQLKSQT